MLYLDRSILLWISLVIKRTAFYLVSVWPWRSFLLQFFPLWKRCGFLINRSQNCSWPTSILTFRERWKLLLIYCVRKGRSLVVFCSYHHCLKCHWTFFSAAFQRNEYLLSLSVQFSSILIGFWKISPHNLDLRMNMNSSWWNFIFLPVVRKCLNLPWTMEMSHLSLKKRIFYYIVYQSNQPSVVKYIYY